MEMTHLISDASRQRLRLLAAVFQVTGGYSWAHRVTRDSDVVYTFPFFTDFFMNLLHLLLAVVPRQLSLDT